MNTSKKLGNSIKMAVSMLIAVCLLLSPLQAEAKTKTGAKAWRLTIRQDHVSQTLERTSETIYPRVIFSKSSNLLASQTRSVYDTYKCLRDQEEYLRVWRAGVYKQLDKTNYLDSIYR